MDAMDTTQEPRRWRLTKGRGSAQIARLPPGPAAQLFGKINGGEATLTEEMESDVSEDEEDPNAPAAARAMWSVGKALGARRGRLSSRALLSDT